MESQERELALCSDRGSLSGTVTGEPSLIAGNIFEGYFKGFSGTFRVFSVFLVDLVYLRGFWCFFRVLWFILGFLRGVLVFEGYLWGVSGCFKGISGFFLRIFGVV